MTIDWNPIIHILDELSDGSHSLLELSYMAAHYERSAFLESLLFLADRRLVELSEAREKPVTLARTDSPQRLRYAFGIEAVAPGLMARTSIDLTSDGEQILRLLNVGHPPLSRSENGS